MTPMLIGIAAFMLLQFAVGIWVSRSIATEDDYLVAGRRMGPLLVTGSIFATWFGAETVVGSASNAYSDGVSIASAEPFAYGLCIILMGLIFAVPLWNRRLTTLADLYRDRYSPLVERAAAVVLIPGSLLWAAAQIRAFGQVIVVSGSGVDLEIALAAATLLVVLYTAWGGLLADATTDVLQAVLLTIGLVVLLGAVIATLGGAGETARLIADSGAVRLLPEVRISVWETLEAWAIPVCGSVVATELVSRVIAARSPGVARASALGAGVIYIAVGTIAVVIGLVGQEIVGTLSDGEQVIPAAARALLSPWLYVVFAGGFLSAILSTVDSTLLISAGLFTHNLVIPATRITNERAKVRTTRIAVAMFGVIAYLLARNAEGVFALVELASSFGSAGILVTVCFALFTRFGGVAAALSTLVMGIGSFVAATLLGAPVPFLISLGASLATYLVVGVVEAQRIANSEIEV